MGKGRLRWGRDGRIGGLDETVWCDVNRRWKDGEAGLKQKWSRLEKQILIRSNFSFYVQMRLESSS